MTLFSTQREQWRSREVMDLSGIARSQAPTLHVRKITQKVGYQEKATHKARYTGTS